MPLCILSGKDPLRYDYIIFNAPYGERILMNDNKPSGMETSKVIRLTRDNFKAPECI